MRAKSVIFGIKNKNFDMVRINQLGFLRYFYKNDIVLEYKSTLYRIR